MKKAIGTLLVILVLLASVFEARSQNMFRKVNDFDGDGKADFAVTRNENGLKVWYVLQSAGGYSIFQWGLGSDQNVAGDYDGDGKTDFAVFRKLTAQHLQVFYIFQSQTNSFIYKVFESNWDLITPVPQDWNADGKIDPATFTAIPPTIAALNVQYSGSTDFFSMTVPGALGLFRIGNMSGDGRPDIAYRLNEPNFTLMITDFPTNNSHRFQFGTFGDQVIPADFDGDGKGDLTVYRPSNGSWWWIRSSDNVVNAATWGINGDTPVPADYDGDGKTDLAIYRQGSQGVYWVYGSQNGVMAVSWGTTTDEAVKY